MIQVKNPDHETTLYEAFQYGPLKTYLTEITGLLAANNFGPMPPMVDNSTYVGIEVEVENIQALPAFPHFNVFDPIWSAKGDESLRNNGVEYVSAPIKGNNIPLALKALEKYLKEHQPKHEFTDRTSVHVHVNVRKLTFEQLLTYVVTYMLVEESLFGYVAKHAGISRFNNINCVPLIESDFYIGLDRAIKAHQQKQYTSVISSFQTGWKKYSALNPLPITNFGTIEFRQMAGTCDALVLITWINLLLSIRKYAVTHTLDETFKTIKELNTNSNYHIFLGEVFGDLAIHVQSPSITHELEAGVCAVKDLLLYVQDGHLKPKNFQEYINSPLHQSLIASKAIKFYKKELTALRAEYEVLSIKYKELINKYEEMEPGEEKKAIRKEIQRVDNRIYELHNLIGDNE